MSEFQLAGKRVWVAGHRGMMGSALMRRLATEGCQLIAATHDELDLQRQSDVEAWMAAQRIDAVILAAARVGGILANRDHPAEFFYQNIAIATNVIHTAWKVGVKKLLFLSSSCSYPRLAAQPMREDSLLTGALEPTNEAYAIAKIAGIRMCQYYRRQYGCDFIGAIPTNLYGPNDYFDPQLSHVIPGMMGRAHQARVSEAPAMSVWGSGQARREFLHVDDAADACHFLLTRYSGDAPVNVGTGSDVTIRELAELMREAVGYKGEITFDASKPDGMPVKRLDVGVLQGLGWTHKIALREGLQQTYQWFLAQPHLRGLSF